MSRASDVGDPLEAALAGLVSDAVQEWNRVQGDTPDLLYHYTDVAGLIGICSSRSLWATNLRFVNDAQELAHAWGLMLDVLAEARARATVPAQVELIEEIERATSSQWAGYPDFYSVSFTADGDLLSQWRGYGSSGGGYAIGFEAAGLVRPPAPYPQPERFLNRVIYDEATQRQILGATAEAMLELFATVDPIGSDLTKARAGVFAASNTPGSMPTKGPDLEDNRYCLGPLRAAPAAHRCRYGRGCCAEEWLGCGTFDRGFRR